jgi:hypothetical protein
MSFFVETISRLCVVGHPNSKRGTPAGLMPACTDIKENKKTKRTCLVITDNHFFRIIQSMQG